jgi:hypothetical protein
LRGTRPANLPQLSTASASSAHLEPQPSLQLPPVLLPPPPMTSPLELSSSSLRGTRPANLPQLSTASANSAHLEPQPSLQLPPVLLPPPPMTSPLELLLLHPLELCPLGMISPPATTSIGTVSSGVSCALYCMGALFYKECPLGIVDLI